MRPTSPDRTPGGNVTSPPTIGVTDTFTDIGTFTGTARQRHLQSRPAPATYIFNGGAGFQHP